MKYRYQKFLIIGQDSRRPLIARPYLAVDILYGKERTPRPFFALLDSGADDVLFPEELAMQVGIQDITAGRVPRTIMGVAGQQADVYFHSLDIQVVGDGRRLTTEVGFSKKIAIPLLGRSFFAHFKSIIFSQIKEEVELKLWL